MELEYCIVCNFFYKKSFKSDYEKSVEHHEILGQYYCRKCNLYMHRLDTFFHLNSDEHKNKNIKVWCEDCGKNITDNSRHFQSGVHRRNKQNNQLNQQNNFSLDTQSLQQSSVQSKQQSCPSV